MKSRSGSALLVVLGMLAFMVISGIAFSAYMRATRMPSSFTRRVVTTRQLAKAALAEAIDQIDRAVANDPHPNVRRGNLNTYNHWVGRVLATADRTSSTTRTPEDVAGDMERDVECKYTVPVLSLEALAYLPPTLVNEARYYGQLTPSATWQSLGFDAGRYAFVAVDVSDYFDVNRVLANEARSSNPARRVNVAHLFDGGEDHSSAPAAADLNAWESFVKNGRTVQDDGTIDYGATPPFVSLADFNLALGAKGTVGPFASPFVEYVKSNGEGAGFYGKATPGDGGLWEDYSRMTFVTDSLSAPVAETAKKTDAGDDVFNLDDDENQPFAESFLNASQEGRSFGGVGQLDTTVFKRFVGKRVPYVTMLALSDYLDSDRVPISLGMPSVERVPMICGVKPQIGASKVKVSVVQNPDNSGNDTEVSGSMANKDPVVKVRRNVRWRLDAQSLATGFNGGMVQTLVVYPFRNHERQSESGWFKLDGKIQAFLSSDAMRLRTGKSDGLLHWSASGDSTSAGSAKLVEKAVLNLPLTAQELSFGNFGQPSECVKAVNLPLAAAATAIATELEGEKGDILNVTYEWERNLDEKAGTYDNGYSDSLPPAAAITEAKSGLCALTADGTVDSELSGVTKSTVASLSKTLRFNVAVTLRVTSADKGVLGAGSGGTKTVDMVPATIFDDKPLNNVDNSNPIVAVAYKDISGEATPLMKFETGVSFDVKLALDATCDAEVKLTLDGSKEASVMVDDPRYNHAPENWKELSDFSPAGWYTAQTSAANDGDILMATSDQEYLQSVYELAFLPRLSNLEQYANAIRGSLPGYPAALASWTSLCEKDPVDRDLMWKTYDIFGRYSDDGDDFEGLGLVNSGSGFRVNPYSDSTNVIMAAFANTPHDWRAASENEDENPGASAQTDVAAFNGEHAWNAYSSGAKISWKDLEGVAREFMWRVDDCAKNSGSWEDALHDLFDQPREEDTEKDLCGIELQSPSEAVYGVDKKFLFGFWRNCFEARQQLFLVFFRAEPMMLGGGIAGVTPPQLGAKGVAVVWRNPNLPKGAAEGTLGYSGSGIVNTSYVPHQTRVLFYRQFD